MKKLLHERLREGDQHSLIYSDGLDSGRIVLTALEAESLADEIDKYYIPRPRFEDGEPVKFGEEFADCSGNPHTLHEIRYRDKAAAGLGAKCLLEANTASSKDYDGISFNLYDGTFVKRPEPKVLDADGVEIKVGDTIYSTQTGVKLTVIEMVNQNGHDLRVRFDDGTTSYAMGELYTHSEQDSLEKVRDDIAEWRADVAIPGNGWDIKTAEWCDRLTALIERGV